MTRCERWQACEGGAAWWDTREGREQAPRDGSAYQHNHRSALVRTCSNQDAATEYGKQMGEQVVFWRDES